MRIVKFFLYVIFLTGLFFVAERIDALSYQETGINRSKWEKSVGNGFNNNEYGFVTSTPVNISLDDKNSYRARFFTDEPLSLKDGEYYIQIPLYFRFDIENMIYQRFDYDSGTGQFTGYFNSKETSVTFNVSLTSSTGVVGNCYFLNDGIHANPTVSCPKFNRLTDIQYITFDVYTLYSNFD